MKLLIPDSFNRDSPNLSEQVFDILQQSITAGCLRPNQRLVELQITKTLGVSRTPVREALKQLEITGYVKKLPKGLAVADFSASDMKSLFEIRTALETMAIKLACQQISEKDIDKAEDYCKRSYEAALRGDISLYLKLHRNFHETLYASCGNEQLFSLLRIFRYQYFDEALTRVFTLRDWYKQIKYHTRILEAVRERNPERAVVTLQRSFTKTLELAMQRFN